VKQDSGILYVVATPIGNLEDITHRAARILGEVALIACEDTRHTRKLISHLRLNTPLTSYYREKERQKTGFLLEKLLGGQSIALVSDAGTPAISDPGSVLVREARLAGITVIPIPGPSALTAALSAAGLVEGSFFFGGFPPARKGERQKYFTRLATLPCPLVFYEAPHRIARCLRDCLDVFGDRRGLLFKELTKIHENSFAGPLSELVSSVEAGIRGELVLIIHGPEESAAGRPDNLTDLLAWYKKQPDMTVKEAVRRISEDLNLPRNQVYAEALAVWKKKDR
jgi:16S rRNA (cytidine1402-2'-O)-methyltransferase